MATPYTAWVTSFDVVNPISEVRKNCTTVVVEKVLNPDNTTTKKLRYFDNYNKPVYISQKWVRDTHDLKKEFEYIQNLDQYHLPCNDLENQLFTKLHGFNPSTPPRLKKLLSSPYIYGADIQVRTHIRHQYLKEMNKHPEIVLPMTIGALDIENEITGGQRINLISYVHENKSFLACLDEYMLLDIDHSDSNNERVKATESDLREVLEKEVGSILKETNTSVEIFIGKTEVDLIRWIFNKIHEMKTDYIGIWNIRHDIPHMMLRLDAYGVNPADIMVHPDVRKDCRVCKYHLSTGKEDHFTDRWDWPDIAGYSQFYDAMCLFSRVRKTKGREPSYALGKVSEKFLDGLTKLIHMKSGSDHSYEQKNHFLRYAAYNLMDSILVYRLEKQNKDVTQMLNQVGSSHPQVFNAQLEMVKNDFFFSSLESGKVIASIGGQNTSEWDDYQSKIGGLVLPPSRARGVGIPLFKDAPNFITQASVGCNDFDFGSEYPSLIESFNISKTTKVATVLAIGSEMSDKEEQVKQNANVIMDFFSNYVSTKENAVYLANRYFNLPNHADIMKLFVEAVDEKIRHDTNLAIGRSSD